MNNSARSAHLGAYLDASIATAGAERLLVMLCERLVLDVVRAREAQQRGNHLAAHAQLLHAQDIVVELRSSLRTETWSGGPGLAALYDYVYARLVHANLQHDLTATEECLTLSTQLRDTWREASLLPARSA